MATILLVDDDPLQAFVRKSILERRFADVQRVADAAEAFCLIEQPRFAEKLALVVSGLHMRASVDLPLSMSFWPVCPRYRYWCWAALAKWRAITQGKASVSSPELFLLNACLRLPINC